MMYLVNIGLFILSLSPFPWGSLVPLILPAVFLRTFSTSIISRNDQENRSGCFVLSHSSVLLLAFLRTLTGLLYFERCQAPSPRFYKTIYRELRFYFPSFNSKSRACCYVLADHAGAGRVISPFVFRHRTRASFHLPASWDWQEFLHSSQAV